MRGGRGKNRLINEEQKEIFYFTYCVFIYLDYLPLGLVHTYARVFTNVGFSM